MTYGVWSYFAPPPFIIVELIVTFCTAGGVMNFFAYTFVRKAANKKEKEDAAPAVPAKPDA